MSATSTSTPTLWPTQERALTGVKELVGAGERSICVTGPTGCGKTRLMAELASWGDAQGWPVVLFTNRRLLTSQASKTLSGGGLDHGLMAAGYDEALLKRVQVASLQTIDRRVGAGRWQLPRAKLVLVDEAHSNKGAVGTRVVNHYLGAGAVVAGFTATPVGIAHLYKRLVVAGTKAELRKLGALVPCYVYAPSEPNLKGVRRTKVGEVEYQGVAKRLMETLVFADVFVEWKKLNPNGLPTILWAPGVEESRWFVEQWAKLGVRAAHIDAETGDAEREQIFKDNECGYTPVICSQGVLREGVDLPWLYHGILCQPCLQLSTFLQVVGRLLRAYEGKEKCVLQDHSGAWWRHGSPNADHEWKLTDTDKSIAAERKKKFEKGDGREPIRCPRCGGIRMMGPKCPHCGHAHVHSVRLVRFEDGTLKEMRGTVFKKKRQVSEDQRLWVSCLYAAANARRPMTVEQARSMFRQRTGRHPEPGTKFLPPDNHASWFLHVTDAFPWLKKRKAAAA